MAWKKKKREREENSNFQQENEHEAWVSSKLVQTEMVLTAALTQVSLFLLPCN